MEGFRISKITHRCSCKFGRRDTACHHLPYDPAVEPGAIGFRVELSPASDPAL
jgi:hypothetical protein